MKFSFTTLVVANKSHSSLLATITVVNENFTLYDIDGFVVHVHCMLLGVLVA